MTNTSKSSRIELVDALRGFAILCIILIHNMERYEFNFNLQDFPQWLKLLDAKVLFCGYFLFGGKAYAIFALLFGFSFFMQHQAQHKLGNDYRLRFLWRMFILLIFGFINTAFYQGDILTMYAILGLVLIPVCNLSNKAILTIAVILMAQPVEWFRFFYAYLHPQYVPTPNASVAYYEQIAAYMNNGNFIDYVVGNVTLGKAASLLWSWENGRFMQAPALFLLGFLIGRIKLFNIDNSNLLFWKKVLSVAIICFVPLYFLGMFLPNFIQRPALLNPLSVTIGSWTNFSFMTIWVALFVLLFQKQRIQKLLINLVPIGKMGLTSYIFQSVVGSTIYYKYGFGLYKYTGAATALFIGIALFLLNVAFCKWWLKTHQQGPLEKIWHQLTFLKFSSSTN
ncbi:DUF418 domain-containing protein [Ferruginibacter yonginensis]|uniref:DUF418 domain-containing protein n=1 Tax=Ferruginibacter yonginensis TaxID=1310416 RepID=A0ABV8QRI3_9BACT